MLYLNIAYDAIAKRNGAEHPYESACNRTGGISIIQLHVVGNQRTQMLRLISFKELRMYQGPADWTARSEHHTWIL